MELNIKNLKIIIGGWILLMNLATVSAYKLESKAIKPDDGQLDKSHQPLALNKNDISVSSLSAVDAAGVANNPDDDKKLFQIKFSQLFPSNFDSDKSRSQKSSIVNRLQRFFMGGGGGGGQSYQQNYHNVHVHGINGVFHVHKLPFINFKASFEVNKWDYKDPHHYLAPSLGGNTPPAGGSGLSGGYFSNDRTGLLKMHSNADIDESKLNSHRNKNIKSTLD